MWNTPPCNISNKPPVRRVSVTSGVAAGEGVAGAAVGFNVLGVIGAVVAAGVGVDTAGPAAAVGAAVAGVAAGAAVLLSVFALSGALMVIQPASSAAAIINRNGFKMFFIM